MDGDFDVPGELNSIGPTKGIKGYMIYQFFLASPLVSGDQDMQYAGPGGAAQMRMPWSGSVVAIGLSTSTGRTAGTLMGRAYNGSSAAIIANSPFPTIDGTNTTAVSTTSVEGQATFNASNLLRLRLTATGYTPLATTVTGFICVKFE